MSFNNYKPDIAVVRNATPTVDQIQQLRDLGLQQECGLNDQHFITWVGGLKSYGTVVTDSIKSALEVERNWPTYPEYVESDAVFNTIDALIKALKP